ALGVARDAGVEVALGLPGVVLRSARRRRPHLGRQVEAAAGEAVAARRGAGDAGAAVAVRADRLLLMARDAARVVLPRRLRVHREPVVGVDLARAHLA